MAISKMLHNTLEQYKRYSEGAKGLWQISEGISKELWNDYKDIYKEGGLCGLFTTNGLRKQEQAWIDAFSDSASIYYDISKEGLGRIVKGAYNMARKRGFISDEMHAEVSAAAEAIGETLDGSVKNMGTIYKAASEKIFDTLHDQGFSTKAVGEMLKTAIMADINVLKEGYTMGQGVGNVGYQVARDTGLVSDTMHENFATIREAAGNIAGEVYDRAKPVVEQGIEDAKGKASEAYKAIKEAPGNLYESTKEGVSDFMAKGKNRVTNTLKTYVPREIEAPVSSVADYQGTGKPLAIRIDSAFTIPGKALGAHAPDLHLQDGIAANYGEGTMTGRPSADINRGLQDRDAVFLIDVEKMGWNTEKLEKNLTSNGTTRTVDAVNFLGMLTAARIRHAMNNAGGNVDGGWMATSRDLSEWCEQAVRDGNAIRISGKEYQEVLKDPSILDNVIKANREKSIAQTKEPKDLEGAKQSIEKPVEQTAQMQVVKDDVALRMQRDQQSQK